MSKLKEMFPNHVLRDKYDYEFPQFTADDMVEFAEEVAKEALKNASDNLKQTVGQWNADFSSQKKSILNENNIPKL